MLMITDFTNSPDLFVSRFVLLLTSFHGLRSSGHVPILIRTELTTLFQAQRHFQMLQQVFLVGIVLARKKIGTNFFFVDNLHVIHERF